MHRIRSMWDQIGAWDGLSISQVMLLQQHISAVRKRHHARSRFLRRGMTGAVARILRDLVQTRFCKDAPATLSPVKAWAWTISQSDQMSASASISSAAEHDCPPYRYWYQHARGCQLQELLRGSSGGLTYREATLA